MYFDNKDLDRKTNQVLDDAGKQRLSSPAWLWIIFGGIGGLLLSCVKPGKADAPTKVVKYRGVTERKSHGKSIS